MSKKYGLTGINENVELGKNGVRVKANAGQVEFRSAADDAMIKIKALDGTSTDDVVTLNQLNAKADSSVVTEIDGNVDDVITLTGVAENSTDLGTFTGTTITDSSTVKTALQELETAVEAADTSSAVKYRSENVSSGDSSPVNIGATVTGSYAFRWQVIVGTGFDGTAPTLELGISGDTDAITGSANIDLLTPGIYSGTSSLGISSSTQIIATYVADGSTSGSCDVIIEWF